MVRNNMDALRNLFDSGILEPYIRYLRFPKFKNLARDTQIDFTFPFTVLIGANGTNKTSILRALQGSPEQCSIGQYWFSTDLDRIKDSDSERSCFIYGYQVPCGNRPIVEVLKTRIQKGSDPDYWEPSRPIKRYGMSTELPEDSIYDLYKSKTRWNAIKKDVVYVDFRENLCAYDKYFYFGAFRGTKTFKNKQARIRYWSKHLKIVSDEEKNSYLLGGGRNASTERVLKNFTLEASAVKTISDILGKKYAEIRMITHRFFDSKEGTTVLLKDGGDGYSEAFAGSGESALAMTIAKIHYSPEKSLILLDEPETSLHPAAQVKLRNYIIEKIKQRHLQVIVSTHSPAFAEALPPDAIKLLSLNDCGEVVIRNEALFPEAFYLVGSPNVPVKIIYVEDRLGKALIEYVAELRRPDLKNALEVVYLPGGAEQILKLNFIPSAIGKRGNAFYVLDGDKQRVDAFVSPDDLPVNKHLEQVENCLGISVKKLNLPFDSSGKGHEEQQRIFFIDILKYMKEGHLLYMPEKATPEHLILKNAACEFCNDKLNGKDDLKKLAAKRYNKENPNADEIFYFGKMIMGSIPNKCTMFDEIERILERVGGDAPI